jgi:hypothetical protein
VRVKKTIPVLTAIMFLLSVMMAPIQVSSLPSPVTVMVDTGGAPYIPEKTVGTKFWVNFRIDASELEFNGPSGIVYWAIYVKTDPAVLQPLGKGYVKVAQPSYFLYQFTQWAIDNWLEGYSYPDKSITVDTAGGLVDVAAMYFAPLPPGGAATTDEFGPLPTPYLLVSIAYEVVGTGSTLIDIQQPEYTALSAPDVLISMEDVDGWYGEPVVPEFPLGSVAPIALIAAIAYIWWVTRRKRQEVA